MSARKRTSRATKKSNDIGLGIPEPTAPHSLVIPPSRLHTTAYHWPLLLSDKSACDALLQWFTNIEGVRAMPWRKEWLNPDDYHPDRFPDIIAERAYEVWVSEVMLQQTRVSTVIPYFNKWIAKWPTVRDLANAHEDDVLSVWKGLGYYSRATRLQDGAMEIVEKKLESKKSFLIPSQKEELMKFPGIGPYTAGAISSIAFGLPEAVLDGNVARVLSRQLGLYADVKDKKTTDLFWKVADRIVKQVSGFPETKKSAVPGQWNQAIMELGSTICTPRPKCEECPIQKTCRAYAEGQAFSDKSKMASAVPDIEDACNYCDALDVKDLVVEQEVEEQKVAKKRKRETKKNTNKISNYFGAKTPTDAVADSNDPQSPQEIGSKKRKAPEPLGSNKGIASYCALFPKKAVKKEVPEEHCVVCMIELRVPDTSSKWLIEQRPAEGMYPTLHTHKKNTPELTRHPGLLASMWQFPKETISPRGLGTTRKEASQLTNKLHSTLFQPHMSCKAKHVAELGSVLHIFTHLKLTMHVHHFTVDADTDLPVSIPNHGGVRKKWVEAEAMENESLSTGMLKCWRLVADNASDADAMDASDFGSL
jgi:A/G-specific adenine glycosylase